MALLAGTRLGPYRIVSLIGSGGMGVVYAARDERLDRDVAIKLLNSSARGEGDGRFWREARAAAALNHPNICQVYDTGEVEGQQFIVMELLEGEPLVQRMRRGAVPLAEAIQIALGILAGLEALHARSLVHRDIKPGNVFLTPHGVKLLDFGLTRNIHVPDPDDTRSVVTQAGLVVGTPRYMSPEQLAGESLDGRSDLFATGTVLCEMSGPDPVPALDRIIRRATAKLPERRYQCAAEMACDLKQLLDRGACPATRLIVLPFRLLRPNTDADFLGFSLADAITASLSGLQSLTVRSSMTATRYANETDLKKIASETEVDLILSGSLLASGDQIRVSAQLVEAASGTVSWSRNSQGSLRDIFALQDQVVQRILSSLPGSITSRDREMLRRDVPASPTAYEYFLRANQIAHSYAHMTEARDLYLHSVDADPAYAPAWARLARCYRVIAKFGQDTESFALAEGAFRRALELNPDLPVAHNLVAQLDADMGRAQESMVRLLKRAETHGCDPELLAGLVHVCRFCGLLEASVAAHVQARRLDPQVDTSICNTYLVLGDYERTLETSRGIHPYLGPLAFIMLGRNADAVELSRKIDLSTVRHALARYAFRAVRALAEGDRTAALEMTRQAVGAISHGPEELFYFARHLAYLEQPEEAVVVLARAVEQGFFCHPALISDPWLDPLRSSPGFRAVVQIARMRHEQAAQVFAESGGERLLGMKAAVV
jgi:serine/threonine protein kinase